MFKRYRTAIIVTVVLFITFLHYTTIPTLYPLHNFYSELYYVPLFLGGLMWGLKGALFIYLMVLIFDSPFIIFGWSGKFIPEVVRLYNLMLQGAFAVFVGLVSQREKRIRDRAQKLRYLAGLGQVSTTIVHDLKNPLITILGFSKRLRECKGDTDEALQEIAGAALSMQRIVDNVLDFAKPMQLDLKVEDICQVISRAYGLCKVRAVKEGVKLLMELPPVPVYMRVDAFLMERAIVNLVNNSIEASVAGQSIVISATLRKGRLIVRIKDEGAGMDKETLDNVFVPFYTRKKSGTGLGMPIVKKVIEEHKGEIEVESWPGEGTEVKIILPYDPALKP